VVGGGGEWWVVVAVVVLMVMVVVVRYGPVDGNAGKCEYTVDDDDSLYVARQLAHHLTQRPFVTHVVPQLDCVCVPSGTDWRTARSNAEE